MGKPSKVSIRIQEMIEQTETQMEMLRKDYEHLNIRLNTLKQAQDSGEETPKEPEA